MFKRHSFELALAAFLGFSGGAVATLAAKTATSAEWLRMVGSAVGTSVTLLVGVSLWLWQRARERDERRLDIALAALRLRAVLKIAADEIEGSANRLRLMRFVRSELQRVERLLREHERGDWRLASEALGLNSFDHDGLNDIIADILNGRPVEIEQIKAALLHSGDCAEEAGTSVFELVPEKLRSKSQGQLTESNVRKGFEV